VKGPAAAFPAGKKEETLAGRRLSLIDEAEEQLEQGLLLSYSLRKKLTERLKETSIFNLCTSKVGNYRTYLIFSYCFQCCASGSVSGISGMFLVLQDPDVNVPSKIKRQKT
jgi:hypothetical protein